MSEDVLDAARLLGLRALVDRPRASAALVTGLPGGTVSRHRGRGVETHDLRSYIHGDDARHVDRHASARTGRLQVRTFQAERDRTAVLIVDFRPSMLWGTRRVLRSVAAAEIACLAGWRISAEGGRIGLVAVTATGTVALGPKAGGRAMVAIVGALVTAHRDAVKHASANEPGLDTALTQARRLAPAGAEIVMVSSLESPGAGFEDAVGALGQSRSLRVERIADAVEEGAPGGLYGFRTPGGQRGVWTGRKVGNEKVIDWLASQGANIAHRKAGDGPEVHAGHV